MRSPRHPIPSVLLLFCVWLLHSQNVSYAVPKQRKENSPLLNAKYITSPPILDGNLDESVWADASVGSDFIQRQPDEGQPATERTEVRILYDASALYIGVMCLDSKPDEVIANVKRRDSPNIYENDHIRILFDTFHDRRNGYIFVTNPLGAKMDLQVRKEGKREGGVRIANPNVNVDWNAVWEVRAAMTDQGWCAEIRIPLNSLRYHERSSEGWGLNILRNIRRKNEESSWAPLTRSLDFMKISIAGTLKGLEKLRNRLTLQIKPYALANRVDSRDEMDRLRSDYNGKAGLDLKYGITSNITADVTINTDFSQVEVDDQQINLTRFSLFYPEKREFFLENAAIFSIGTPEDAMVFFSRRIGLSPDGEEIPLYGGVKIAGKMRGLNLGLISLQTQAKGDMPSNNFTVVRLSKDIFSQSTLGFLVTNRQSAGSSDFNRSLCIDGDFVFGRYFSLSGFFALTQTPNLTGNNHAGKFGFKWLSDLWDIYGYYFDVGDNFNVEMGFVPRTGIRRTQLHFGYTPEPDILGIRRLNPHAFYTYTTNQGNRLLLQRRHFHLQIDFIKGGNVGIQWNNNDEFVDIPFDIQEDITIPVDTYTDTFWQVEIRTNKSRNLYSLFSYRWGSFYGGRSKILNLTGGFRPFPNLFSEVSFVSNAIDLPVGAFINHLLKARLTYSISTRLSLMSLIQWNSEDGDFSVNMRLHFIHTLGSDLFVVYNERRFVEGFATGVQERSIAVKFNYLFTI